MKKNSNTKNLILTIIILSILLGIAIFISRFFGDFSNLSLKKNKKTIFSSNDLIISSINYGATEKEVKEKFKTPIKESTYTDNSYNYKILKYKGLIITLKENYDEYILVKAEITSKKYSISRNIKVGDYILSTINKFRIDNKKGVYLYGNYTADALDSNETNDEIYFGVRSKDSVIYVNRDSVVDGKYTYISKLILDYDHGKINKITLSYDIK